MTGTTTLVLGAGFGGIAAARTLRASLGPEHRVVLIDRRDGFCAGAAYIWAMMGSVSLEAMTRPIRPLLPGGVEFVQAGIEVIDIDRGTVRTTDGEFRGDHLVIALGAIPDMTLVPGLAEAGHTFFTAEGALRAAEALDSFRGGDLLMAITRTPFKCPPAPYEAAMVLHADLMEHGILGSTRMDLVTVEGAPMMTAGPQMGALIRGEIERRGIGYHPKRKTVAVHPDAREIEFEDGGRMRFDLLLAVPPHVAPRAVADGGLLNASGWIPVNPHTLELAEWGGRCVVHAVGDVTTVGLPGAYDPRVPLVLPKAGVFAAAQGEVAARCIAARLGGDSEPARFDGRGFCYLETGGGMALRADGDFFALPHPVTRPDAPSAARLHEKQEWVRRLPDR